MSKVVAAIAAAAVFAAAAEPIVPTSDAEVIERLPQSMWKRPARAARLDETAASGEARRLVEVARHEGDPRYLGQAQAALRPWWDLPRPSAEVLLLRATIRQALHEFDAALRDLDAILDREPRHAQALLTRAAILLARGRPAEAQADCLRLVGRTSDLVTVACATQAASLAGHGEDSYAALRGAIEASTGAPAPVRLWALTSLAEMSARLGRHAEAERHFRAALALSPRDAYLLGAYCDWLLDRGRSAEITKLVDPTERNDALLLRRVLALHAMTAPAAQSESLVLRERFAAQRQRGESLHAREEARFRLAFDADPREALRLALENWERQREPADLRVLLQAALAANEPAAARPAIEWIRRMRYEDAAIRSLAAGLS